MDFVPLERSALVGNSVEVAPTLLGARLTLGPVTVRITEVEAYLGADDPGSHAFRGLTKRNSTMFGEPGHLYTYFTYGMHVCANVVCSPEGVGHGVLLRAGEVTNGVELARARRHTSKIDADLARGPGRLAVAMGITLDHNGEDLLDGPFTLELPASAIEYQQGPRTGVSGDGGTDNFPWRFWIPGDPTVSPYRRSTPRRIVR
ncbi:MAG TPA: DNA-3-methyladenine glycosylase [Glaciihabitans sp.]|jgi:DNA-3-methyladenine glycosylase|nr:DNA-3-methyladenine glycosylase [Glaciihabitans sp.]